MQSLENEIKQELSESDVEVHGIGVGLARLSFSLLETLVYLKCNKLSDVSQRGATICICVMR